MKTTRFLIAFFAIIGVCSALRASPTDITYSIDQTVGSGGVTGTITTKGTIGTLITTDILGWGLLLNEGNGSPTFTLTPANSNVFLDGDDLTATPMQLLFDFGTGAPEGSLSFGTPPTFYDNWFVENVGIGYGLQGEGLSTTGGTPPEFTIYTGTSEVIAATPESNAGILMLIGVGFLGLTVMRKRNSFGHLASTAPDDQER